MRKVTLSFDDTLWRQFRIGCIEHQTPASTQLARMIAEQLAQWAHERKTADDDREYHDTP